MQARKIQRRDACKAEFGHEFVVFPPGSGNVLKVQQLLHICSEHFDSKEKEEEKEKKEKKDKEKKEASADMGAHQVTV